MFVQFTEIKPPPPIKQENSHGIVKTEVKQEVPETTTTTSVGGARLKEEDYDSSTTVWRLIKSFKSFYHGIKFIDLFR